MIKLNDVVINPTIFPDGGVKKSAKGLLRVNEDMTLSECVTEEEENQGLLEVVFENGKLMREQSLNDIREKLKC